MAGYDRKELPKRTYQVGVIIAQNDKLTQLVLLILVFTVP